MKEDELKSLYQHLQIADQEEKEGNEILQNSDKQIEKSQGEMEEIEKDFDMRKKDLQERNESIRGEINGLEKEAKGIEQMIDAERVQRQAEMDELNRQLGRCMEWL